MKYVPEASDLRCIQEVALDLFGIEMTLGQANHFFSEYALDYKDWEYAGGANESMLEYFSGVLNVKYALNRTWAWGATGGHPDRPSPTFFSNEQMEEFRQLADKNGYKLGKFPTIKQHSREKYSVIKVK